MWLKIITFAGAALSLYFMLGRFMGGGRDKGAAARTGETKRGFGGVARKQGVEDLVACPRCGAYKNSSDLCDCEKAPVP